MPYATSFIVFFSVSRVSPFLLWNCRKTKYLQNSNPMPLFWWVFFSCAWANFCKNYLNWGCCFITVSHLKNASAGTAALGWLCDIVHYIYASSLKCCELDEVIYFALKSTQLVKDPDQHRSSLCMQRFSIPLGLFVKPFFVHWEIWGIMLWMLISRLQCKWDLDAFVN